MRRSPCLLALVAAPTATHKRQRANSRRSGPAASGRALAMQSAATRALRRLAASRTLASAGKGWLSPAAAPAQRQISRVLVSASSAPCRASARSAAAVSTGLGALNAWFIYVQQMALLCILERLGATQFCTVNTREPHCSALLQKYKNKGGPWRWFEKAKLATSPVSLASFVLSCFKISRGGVSAEGPPVFFCLFQKGALPHGVGKKTRDIKHHPAQSRQLARATHVGKP